MTASLNVISGIGTDIVRIQRMRDLRRRHPTRLATRILHDKEQNDYRVSRDKDAFLARRFAAKEAVVKALGAGFSRLSARAVRIAHDANGQPVVVLPAHIDRHIMISIADEKEYAVATALALSTESFNALK